MPMMDKMKIIKQEIKRYVEQGFEPKITRAVKRVFNTKDMEYRKYEYVVLYINNGQKTFHIARLPYHMKDDIEAMIEKVKEKVKKRKRGVAK